jgi:uncharacterized membrane protein
MEIILAILSVIFTLFLPGFLISLIFFQRNQIDIIERIALSFALSIAVVPLVVFYTNLLGVKITTINVSIQVLGILLLSSGIIFIKDEIKKRKKHKKAQHELYKEYRIGKTKE